MMTFTVASTKGGVGKTTLTANLGALLADLGKRVLLVDADTQPSLSKYFGLAESHPAAGLTAVLLDGAVGAECITATAIRNLDIVVSDDPAGHLSNWLLHRIDRGARLKRALQSPSVASQYDFVLIDTQGALGPVQDAAVLAADVLVSPIAPEILSAREFRDGTLELLARLEPGSTSASGLGPVKAVIYRQDRTGDARMIAEEIRHDFARLQGRFEVLETVVPYAKAYKEAATLRLPVHQHERRREGVMPSAWTVMHHLAWELVPDLRGTYAGQADKRDGSA